MRAAMGKRMATVWLLGLILACDVSITVFSGGHLCAAAAFVLLWVLPGWAWGRALKGRWLAGLGLGVALNVFVSLWLVYLPGPVPFGLSLIVFTLSAVIPILIPHARSFWSASERLLFVQTARSALPNLSQGGAILSLSGDGWLFRTFRKCVHACKHVVSCLPIPLFFLLIVASSFRIPNLGYSEFQGDEGVIMLRAAVTIEGNDEQLFLHQKGPAEVLLPLASWRLSGTINEFWARLPFAWLSLLAVAAVAHLGARWFDLRGGLIAGMFLAVSGLHVAFARIVQNQSFVVLMGLSALSVLNDYRERGRTSDILLGAVFLALSVLGHYDAILSFPAAIVLALRLTPGRPWRFKAMIFNRAYLLALLLGVVILALFYVPFAFHPNFAKTFRYLAEDRVQADPGLHLNFEKLWGVSTVYNSTYYYVLLLLLVFASVFVVKTYPLSLYAWLTFSVPFCFYFVIVSDPRTHAYTFYAGAALLAGATLSALWERVRRTRWRWGVAAVGAGLYVLCAGYVWMVYVDHTPEYLRTFPEHKSPLYWTSYDQMFSQGLFGFPYRAGWHAIGGLIAQGEITGIYATNEEQEITDWYTRHAPRSHCPMPDVYIAAENVQDPIYIDRGEIARDYALAGMVTVSEETRIRWYTRKMDGSPGTPEIQIVAEADYRQWWRPAEVSPHISGWTYSVDVTLGEVVRLLGYDLDESRAVPGGWIRVTLYWQPLTPLRRNYQVFTHMYDGQKLWAQHDGAPECTINATTRWEPGQLVLDQHIIPLPSDIPLGSIPLLVGMYDLLTHERLTVPGAVNNAIHLADIDVQSTP
jgi:hypothetical protein